MEHEAKPEDIRALLAVADRDLADSRIPGLSTDGTFSHAYNAALQAAAAALAASGYRAARGSHHHVIIQSLAKTVGADAGTVGKFDRFRKKRNTAEYEMVGGVTELEATEMVALAARLRKDIEEWIRLKHPELL
jgi:uncharacterized protein (UPF0332 family)